MLKRNRQFILFGLPATDRSWRGFTLLFLVYFGAILFAAITAPWVYKMVIAWAESSPNNMNQYLYKKGFEDYFDRLRWIPVVLLLPWLLITTRLWSLSNLGITFKTSEFKRFIKWFIGGAALIAIIAWLQYQYAVSLPKTDIHMGKVVGIVAKALAGGLVLAFLEEIVFRGLILRIFYTAAGPLTAILLGSLFFAYTHFKMPDKVWQELNAENTIMVSENSTATSEIEKPKDIERVKWWSGFFVAKWTILGISVDFQFYKFLNLFLLAVLLSILTLRSHSLMPAIGLHAGIILGMLSYRKTFDIYNHHNIMGGNQIVDGLLPTIMLGVLIVASMIWPISNPKHS